MTRGTTLATRTRIAGTSADRRHGLLGTRSWRPGDALWIAPCEAIHTLGMKWPIDAIFLDKNKRIRKLSRSLRPWRITVCWTAASVLELPVGALLESGTQVGDILSFHLTSS